MHPLDESLLRELRGTLLHLHKTLLDWQRAEYELWLASARSMLNEEQKKALEGAAGGCGASGQGGGGGDDEEGKGPPRMGEEGKEEAEERKAELAGAGEAGAEEESEETEDPLADKLAAGEELRLAIDELFDSFLSLRLDADWEAIEVERLRQWVRSKESQRH